MAKTPTKKRNISKARAKTPKKPAISAKWRKLFKLLPNYDVIATAGKAEYFDANAAEMACGFFPDCLIHIKGEMAGQPFELRPWQQALVGCLWGWKRADGTRRFRECLLYIPRKNGKSILAAGLALLLFFTDGEGGAEIYSAAAEADQAALVFDVAKGMVRHEDELSSRCTIYNRAIVQESTASVYKVLTAKSETKHGLNAHGLIVDEVHAHQNRELIDTLVTSTGGRRQPLTVYLTTADFDRPSICNELYTRAKATAKGTIPDTGFLPVIFEASKDDNWKAERTWKKANPNYGVSLGRDYVRREVMKADADPLLLPTFQRLHLNVRTGAASSYIALPDWDLCAEAPPVAQLTGLSCFAGLDLSATNDLTALVLIFPIDDGEAGFDILPWFWIPEEDARAREHRDKVPYEQWARDGLVNLTPGRTIDHDRVEADITAIFQDYQVLAVACDSWNSVRTQRRLADDGYNVVETRQGFRTLNEPTKRLSNLTRAGLLRHGGHPVLRWNIDNCMVERDAADNVKPSKRKSTGRIDGAAALINAIYLSLLDVEWDDLLYKDHGVRYV